MLILLGVSILVFAATQALPGDPARQILGHAAAPDQLEALRTELGLDRPLLSQYSHWLGDLLRGSFGTSLDDARAGLERDLGPRPRTRSRSCVCSAVHRDPALARCSARSPRCAATARSTTRSQLVLLVLTALPEFVIGLGLLLAARDVRLPRAAGGRADPARRQRRSRTRASWRCRC